MRVPRHSKATADPDRPVPAPPTSKQLGGLGRAGRFISKHHRWIALLWLMIIMAAGYLNVAFAGKTSDSFSVPGTNSQAAYDLLSEKFPSQNAATATLVFWVPQGEVLTSPQNAATIASIVAAVQKVQNVAPNGVFDPILATAQAAKLGPGNLPTFLSPDGQIAYTNVTFSEPVTTLLEQFPPNGEKAATSYPNPYNALQTAIDTANVGDVQVKIGGTIADTWNQPVSWWGSHADEVGLGLGAILLLVAFGSIFGMAIPISTALFGAITAGGLVLLLADFITVSSAAPKVTLMIAIGVGLDYSLLIVTRYRQFLRDGYQVNDAVGMALATAGKAALFAGVTVAIALLGLLLVPIPLVKTLGVAAAIGVGVMILAALTLLPALFGLAGHKIDSFRFPFSFRDTSADPESSFWGRFATLMSRRPWTMLLSGTVVLLICAVPFLSIDFGMPDDSSMPTNLSQQQAFVLMNEGFGQGVNAPLIVVASVPGATGATLSTTLQPLTTSLAVGQPAGTVAGIQYAVGPIPNPAGDAAIYQIIPSGGPNSSETQSLVSNLRKTINEKTAGTNIEAYVGGSTATLIDLTDLVVKYLPYVVGAVVLGAFILLVMVFRSILVPLKAAFMNLISIAAAYGIVVAVFQWGWAKELVGLHTTIPIVSFVPLIMFVILFGLSMDYEVFLMSRIREEWDTYHEPRKSVVLGVANTARVITTAALIMIAVFFSFVTIQNPTVQVLGFGMAVAVLLDSTIVRMVLVPAAMELFGKAAWWFPKSLEWLPKLNIEGSAELRDAEKSNEQAMTSAGTPRSSV
ncbi:MAG: MMPL family transporter [Actinomycetes bacterium]